MKNQLPPDRSRPAQARRCHGRHRAGQRTGLARALSKLGVCSRSQAWELVKAGRVRVNGVVVRDPERRTDWRGDRIEVDRQAAHAQQRVYLMLNKPRGLATTTSDEQGRATVFSCFAGSRLPMVSPVGRLDKASEGLLLFTNDTAWAAQITAPESQLDKVYHVQVDCQADQALTQRMQAGVTVDGDFLKAKRVQVLRQGTKNSWLEVVLDEGKNRHIRRLLGALNIGVLRLVRVAIGPLQLGALAKGAFRHLTREEVRGLALPLSQQKQRRQQPSARFQLMQ
ncbi:MAG: rRNA pseudouridine synthase [Chloroflexi bacterium]|nr:rRNA pseudouridine synthase [Chloroflexota bacterium]